jgi:hypothetical protein
VAFVVIAIANQALLGDAVGLEQDRTGQVTAGVVEDHAPAGREVQGGQLPLVVLQTNGRPRIVLQEERWAWSGELAVKVETPSRARRPGGMHAVARTG